MTALRSGELIPSTVLAKIFEDTQTHDELRASLHQARAEAVQFKQECQLLKIEMKKMEAEYLAAAKLTARGLAERLSRGPEGSKV